MEQRSRPHEHATAARRRVVLVTGAGGRVGRALRPFLRARDDLRLLDIVPVQDPEQGESVVVADLADYDAVSAAMRGVDAVVHLACVHGLGLRFDESLPTNFTGTMHLLEAMRELGVRRHVYASSHHVLGAHASTRLTPVQAAALDLAPDAVYGLGKAFGELASRLYAARYGIKTMVIRIGNADPQVGDGRSLRLWTSARDLAQLVTIGLDDERIGFDVVYGVSRSPDPLFANERAAELGYRPQDDAGEHLAPSFVPYDAMPAELGRDFVGGAYAVRDLPHQPTTDTSEEAQ